MGINVQADISKGLSTFKVDIFEKNGSKKSFPFPVTAKEPFKFHTDNEAIAGFKEFHGNQNYNDVFEKNLDGQDVLCKFTDREGVSVNFVRTSLSPWLEEPRRY